VKDTTTQSPHHGFLKQEDETKMEGNIYASLNLMEVRPNIVAAALKESFPNNTSIN
jgi:hypothetical protein